MLCPLISVCLYVTSLGVKGSTRPEMQIGVGSSEMAAPGVTAAAAAVMLRFTRKIIAVPGCQPSTCKHSSTLHMPQLLVLVLLYHRYCLFRLLQQVQDEDCW